MDLSELPALSQGFTAYVDTTGTGATFYAPPGGKHFSSPRLKMENMSLPKRVEPKRLLPPTPPNRRRYKVTRNEVHSKYKALLTKVGQPLRHADQQGLRREIDKITPREAQVMGPEQKSRLAMWFVCYDPNRVAEVEGAADCTEITWFDPEEANVAVNGNNKRGPTGANSNPSAIHEYIPAKLKVFAERMLDMKLPDEAKLVEDLGRDLSDELRWIRRSFEEFYKQDQDELTLYEGQVKAIKVAVDDAARRASRIQRGSDYHTRDNTAAAPDARQIKSEIDLVKASQTEMARTQQEILRLVKKSTNNDQDDTDEPSPKRRRTDPFGLLPY